MTRTPNFEPYRLVQREALEERERGNERRRRVRGLVVNALQFVTIAILLYTIHLQRLANATMVNVFESSSRRMDTLERRLQRIEAERDALADILARQTGTVVQ